MKKFIPITASLLICSFTFSGCETPGQSAGAGAAAGAILTAAAGGRTIDVLHGAAIGAGAGYIVGKIAQHDRREEEEYYNDEERGGYRGDHDRYDDRDRERDDDRGRDRDYRNEDRGRLPAGRLTRRPGFVISPYYPHNRIDVRGIPSGAKVMDPSTNHVFINP